MVTTQLNQDDLQRHEANKREAFDGMRAYQASEIAHKAHTVDVIKTFLTLVVGAYGGLITLILKAELAPDYAKIASGLLLLGIFFVVGYVVYKTNAKIDSDHRSYEAHRDEYLAERRLLELDSALSAVGHTTHWVPRPLNARSGYAYTKNLTFALGAIVVLAAVFGSILSVAASLTREPGTNPSDTSTIDDPLLQALAAVRAADPQTMKWTLRSLEPENDRQERKVVLMKEGRYDGYVVILKTDARTVLSLQPTTLREQTTTNTPMTISGVQERLRALGYYTGNVDGMMGPLTTGALRRFQQKSNLTVTGAPDVDTLRLLMKYPVRQ